MPACGRFGTRQRLIGLDAIGFFYKPFKAMFYNFIFSEDISARAAPLRSRAIRFISFLVTII